MDLQHLQALCLLNTSTNCPSCAMPVILSTELHKVQNICCSGYQSICWGHQVHQQDHCTEIIKICCCVSAKHTTMLDGMRLCPIKSHSEQQTIFWCSRARVLWRSWHKGPSVSLLLFNLVLGGFYKARHMYGQLNPPYYASTVFLQGDTMLGGWRDEANLGAKQNRMYKMYTSSQEKPSVFFW